MKQSPRKLVSRNYSEDLLSQVGLDFKLLINALIFAVGSGIVAAILDEVFDLPTANVALTLGVIVAVLNGMTYGSFKRCSDGICLITGILNGWLAYMVWYFTAQIIVSDSSLISGMDWFEATLTGLVAGFIGFAWFMLITLLPNRLRA